jgi:hypothetical protein
VHVEDVFLCLLGWLVVAPTGSVDVGVYQELQQGQKCGPLVHNE